MALNHRVVSDGFCVSREFYLHSYFHDFTVGKGDRVVVCVVRVSASGPPVLSPERHSFLGRINGDHSIHFPTLLKYILRNITTTWQTGNSLRSSAVISKRFQARLLKTGPNCTNGLSGKGQPPTKLKPSNVQRRPIPGLTWSGCGFATSRISAHGRISHNPLQSLASFETGPLPKSPIRPLIPPFVCQTIS